MADSLHPMESYEGSQTRITMKTVNKANFICSFKEIQNFPFNTQICSFKIFVSGTDNLVTRLNMIETIRNVGPNTVDQYMVLGWRVSEDNVTEESRGECRTVNQNSI